MKKNENYVIGIDYGTASVRSVLVDAHTGKEIAVGEFEYPRWKQGLYCDPSESRFRQHPLDYLEGLEATVKSITEEVSPEIAQKIRAISVDTTGSTPVAVDERGIPLALRDDFRENPNAMFFLWKDHSAIKEAEKINAHAENFKTDYLQYSGGIYSSEWYWAKLLYAVGADETVREACASWVEHCDWIPFLLTGGNQVEDIKRSVCAAGHKALWAKEHGGLPPKDFFVSLDPLMENFEYPFYSEVFRTDEAAGNLSAEWAKKLGLNTDVLVGIGAIDAHVGAVGGQIEPYYLSKVMGTSTCDMLVVPPTQKDIGLVPGICGQVHGSIVPDMLGLEAGQSAFGDAYAWFGDLITRTAKDAIARSDVGESIKLKIIADLESKTLKHLSEEAEKLSFDENSEMAIDWLNGRRTPDADPNLKGGFFNLDLGSDAPKMYRSLVEATCFGAKKIVEHYLERDIPIKGVIALGGVAKKSRFVMQMMADVLGMPIKVHRSEQTCALGACMFATVVAGLYPDVQEAMSALGQGFDTTYRPDPDKTGLYEKRYEKYKVVGRFLEENLTKK